MKKKVVLQVIKSLGRGGAEMLLVETLKAHDLEKFDFHYIYFLPHKNQMVDALTASHGKVTCIPARNNMFIFLRIFALTRYIRKHNVDVVHAHLPWAGIVSRIAGRITRTRVLYTEHNKQERYHWATRMLNLATMSWQERVIAVSDDVKESIVKFKPGVRDKVVTVLNGVDTSRFKKSGSKQAKIDLGIPEEASVISTIAVFRVQKRLDIWLDIARMIRDKRPNTHFIIVGDGPLRDQVHKKMHELSLDGFVHLVGLQTNVQPYLDVTDLFMITSVFEGLPVALLEAMSCGIPVISTDAGGIKQVVRHNVEGYLTSVDTPYELSDYALSLLANEYLRLGFGAAARDNVIKNFSIRKMVANLESLF